MVIVSSDAALAALFYEKMKSNGTTSETTGVVKWIAAGCNIFQAFPGWSREKFCGRP
jgi:hypothetical protein